ncbi:hypothetical protein [Ascidiimonas aurantiaca]|uniref:hypothetical protein n=1 Tax=Ascidiimonas aurantiaca TaxID=1685432 RepID=UPI0030EC5F90
MEIQNNVNLVKLAYTQRIAKNFNETGQKISVLLEELAKENQTHENIVDDFLDFANAILPKLKRQQQVELNEFVQRIAKLRITANKGIECMVQLLNDQNKLTKESTEELKELIEKSR